MASCKNDKQEALAANDINLAVESMKAQLEQQKMELIKQKTIDSMQMIAEVKLPTDYAVAPAPQVRHATVRKNKRSSAPRSVAVVETPVAQSPAPVQSSTIPATLPAEKKKGWSATAKGAVIGAGVGAIGGAVINKKNRGKGAIIGGLIGAAAGAGTGILIDRKARQTEWQ